MIIYVLANAISRPGTMGGNTKILLEFIRRWAADGHQINIITYEGGFKTCQNYGLKQVRYMIVSSDNFTKFGTFVFWTVQIIKTLNLIKHLKKEKDVIIYSASNFLPDVIPAIIMKKRFPGHKWIGTCYLLTPNPLKGFDFAFEKRFKLPNLKIILSYLMDKVILPVLIRYADIIFVTNDLDKVFFEKRGFNPTLLKAIYGGVSLKEIEEVPNQKIRYDGCFVGRIHPQKGVIYLVKIWDYVYKKKPDAKLALIGNGPKDYMKRIRNKIKSLGLEDNVDLLGFVDGIEKYKILKASRVFCHTSIYDNSGMAAAEAMACGLPAVRFNIPALKVAYPEGMLVAPLRDCQGFGDKVLQLLQNQEVYDRVKKEAINLAKKWDWDKRACEVMLFIRRNILQTGSLDE